MGQAQSADTPAGGPSVLLIDEVLEAALMQCKLADVKPLFFLSTEITAKMVSHYKVSCNGLVYIAFPVVQARARIISAVLL